FPAFVLQFEVLNGDGVLVRVQVRKGLKFRYPTAIDLVADRELTRFVVDVKNEILAEIFQRNFRAEAGTEVPNFVRPFLKLGVVGNAALERDRFILGAARRFAAAARIATFAMLDWFRGAFERADLAHAGHVAAVPFYPELEVFVGIETS